MEQNKNTCRVHFFILTSFLILFFLTKRSAAQYNAADIETGSSAMDGAALQQFFAQCMLTVSDTGMLISLETSLRTIETFQTVRVDIPTRRLFIVTRPLKSFDEQAFQSLMMNYSIRYTCLQTGRFGKDTINSFPFTNCQDK